MTYLYIGIGWLCMACGVAFLMGRFFGMLKEKERDVYVCDRDCKDCDDCGDHPQIPSYR